MADEIERILNPTEFELFKGAMEMARELKAEDAEAWGGIAAVVQGLGAIIIRLSLTGCQGAMDAAENNGD